MLPGYQSACSHWYIDTAPHILPIVLLKFLFQFPPVAVLALLNLHFKFSLNLFHLLPVPVSEGPLLLIQDDLDVSGDPWFVAYNVQSLLEQYYPHIRLCTLSYNPWVHQCPQRVNYRAQPSLLLQSSPTQPHWSPMTILSQSQAALQAYTVVIWSSEGREGYWGSLTLAYSTSRVFFPLVVQSTNCLNVINIPTKHQTFFIFFIHLMQKDKC